jgi:ribosomal protein L21E
MTAFTEGDHVRIDIPDKDDPDFRFHRKRGVVVSTLADAAGKETADPRDGILYRVELDSGDTMDFRWRDLRPCDDE